MEKIIIMGYKEYEIVSNENDYDLRVDKNTLFLNKGEETYITIDLDKVCLGTKLAILSNVGITLKEITRKKNLFGIWLERNPGKTWNEFLIELKETLNIHSKNIGFISNNTGEEMVFLTITSDGIDIGSIAVPKELSK
ncbi:MAG: hypothetical protein ACRCTZ_14275 [Sarcina sp.]